MMRIQITVLCVALAVLSLSAADVDFREPPIVPTPHAISHDAHVAVRLAEGIKVTVTCPDVAAKEWIENRFKPWFGVTPSVGIVERAPTDMAGAEGAYRLTARPGEIAVAARGLQGIRYAMYTLRQAAERESRGVKLVGYWLPALEVRDEPALGFRGLHLCWFPEQSATFIEHQIRLAAYYKFNVVVLESWGVFRSERHPELAVANAPLTVAEAGRLAALAKDLGVALVPQVNVFGHAAMSRSCVGKHVTLDVHPELQPLFEPAGGWNWCLSNPEARAVLLDYVDEVHAAFGRPRFFHIGCDEADEPTCPTCRAVKPYATLVERHIVAVRDMLKENGARAMMWHDMLLEKGDARWKGFYANGSADEARMLETLPKDIVICDWYYGSDPGGQDATGGKVEKDRFPTLEHFKASGFDTVTCPWRAVEGIRAQGLYARSNGLFGILETVWHHFRGSEFADMMKESAEAAWGDGNRRGTVWVSPFAVHWRQVGWDMGITDSHEHGYCDTQVTRGILDR